MHTAYIRNTYKNTTPQRQATGNNEVSLQRVEICC